MLSSVLTIVRLSGLAKRLLVICVLKISGDHCASTTTPRSQHTASLNTRPHIGRHMASRSRERGRSEPLLRSRRRNGRCAGSAATSARNSRATDSALKRVRVVIVRESYVFEVVFFRVDGVGVRVFHVKTYLFMLRVTSLLYLR